MSFVGGKLKLKGGVAGKPAKKKKAKAVVVKEDDASTSKVCTEPHVSGFSQQQP